MLGGKQGVCACVGLSVSHVASQCAPGSCLTLCTFQPLFSFLVVLLLARSACLPCRHPCKERLSLTSLQAAPVGVLGGGKSMAPSWEPGSLSTELVDGTCHPTPVEGSEGLIWPRCWAVPV